MISVVIPARDEVRAIAGVVRRVGEALAGESHEILVVDDGSRDGTGAVAREAGARVLTLTGVGYGAAIKVGVAQARGTLLALIDADGTYPEAALPELVAAVRGGARQAIGARPKLGAAEPFARSAVKALFRGAVRWLGGFEAPDLNSGLRVLRTADLLSLSPVLPDRFSLTTTLTLALAAAGDPIVFLPISYHARVGRSKWRPVRDTWLMGRTVARGIGWLRAGQAPRTLVALELPAVGGMG
ncbi:glycosyltransferase family 2 protein [Archangium sp.]|uniref:glycosyltransferase family 2 protein n=1 Tax=Archangium sp. TaxID=1872627 RepID=UPI002D28E2F7|nr:glycosyltransferase family 2 protein [Archangium sp.]HYO58107.1 glycosyltransferase family 2 protein [Archangium sp.]